MIKYLKYQCIFMQRTCNIFYSASSFTDEFHDVLAKSTNVLEHDGVMQDFAYRVIFSIKSLPMR